jgi:hypothetical protein
VTPLVKLEAILADMHERVTDVIASKLKLEKTYAAEVTAAIFDAMKDPTEAMCASVSLNINADSVWRQMVRAMTSPKYSGLSGPQQGIGQSFGIVGNAGRAA